MINIKQVEKKPFFSIIIITSHLGKNPIKGGNPPRDRKFINKINLVFFLSVYIKFNCCIQDTLNILKKYVIVDRMKE